MTFLLPIMVDFIFQKCLQQYLPFHILFWNVTLPFPHLEVESITPSPGIWAHPVTALANRLWSDMLPCLHMVCWKDPHREALRPCGRREGHSWAQPSRPPCQGTGMWVMPSWTFQANPDTSWISQCDSTQQHIEQKNHSAEPTQITDPQRFGVGCYTAIGNWNIYL